LKGNFHDQFLEGWVGVIPPGYSTDKGNGSHRALSLPDGDLYGTAELLNGTGYLFREDGQRTATLVSYRDPNLLLFGVCDLADTQHDVDMLVGGYAAVACSREEGVQ
jgi:hypothetical protein